MSMTRWKPSNEIVSLRDAMDRMLEESFFWPRGLMSRALGGAEFIPLDIFEKGNNLIVKAPLPGVKPEDLNIEVHEKVLTISGETKQEEERKEKDYHLQEQRYGRFERSVTLPCAVKVDKAEADYDDGVLTLTLPKAEETKGKKIAVKPKEKSKEKPEK